MADALDRAVATAAAWPVDHVAVAVVDPSGIRAVHGAPQRPFRLASVTKPLAAMAVLVAVEEGAVTLDQPAGPPGATLRHLLSHASGLPFSGRRPVATAGSRRIYSNSGIEMAAELVAAETGIDFAEYFAQALTVPLALTATTLTGSPAHAASSTAVELARVAQELLAPTLLHPLTLAEARSVQFPGLSGVLPGFGRQQRNDWGLGVEIRGDKRPHWTGLRNSPATFGHFGQTGTFLWVDPVAGIACVGLTDREFGSWAAQAWPVFADAVLAAVE